MHADHAAKGLLASGATAKKAVKIFETETSAAITKAGGEAASIIQSRGAAWTKAMKAIHVALEQQIADAMEILAASLRLARIDRSTATGAAVQKLIDEAAARLRAELTAFEDGWTAPKPKMWNERHPILYAVALLILGSLVGAAIAYLVPKR
jgi:hypothetical protein